MATQLKADSKRADANHARAMSLLSPWFIVPLMTLIILLARIPAILQAGEFNVDESQMMAQAMRFNVDLIPWRGMDGTTGGPVNSWTLFLANRLGMPLNYQSTHALAAAAIAGGTILSYAALRAVFTRGVAAAGGAAAVLCIVLAQRPDFVHFSSEVIPTLLTNAAVLCIALALSRPAQRTWLYCLAAFLVGMLPWAKLQALPITGIVGGWIILDVWLTKRLPEPFGRRTPAAVILASLACPSVLILSLVVTAGAAHDFWTSYIQANSAYAGKSDLASILKAGITLLTTSQSSGLISGSLVFVLVWAGLGALGWRLATPARRRFLFVASLLALASALAVLIPMNRFEHHQLFLFHPFATLAAAVLGIWMSAPRRGIASRIPLLVFAGCVLAPQLTGAQKAIGDARHLYTHRILIERESRRETVRSIRRICPDAKKMAVWGWMPWLYVQTGILPATRHSIAHMLIDRGPARERFRATFLSDIRREQPELIIDCVASGYHRWGWSSEHRLNSFPELAAYVNQHYALVLEKVFDNEAEPIRFYVSRRYLSDRRER